MEVYEVRFVQVFCMDGVDTLVRVEYAISWMEGMERKMKIP